MKKMITKKELELYRELANKLNSQVQNSNDDHYQVTVKDYSNLVDELLSRLEECIYKEENTIEALEEMINFEESSFIPNNDMKAWLLSLGDW